MAHRHEAGGEPATIDIGIADHWCHYVLAFSGQHGFPGWTVPNLKLLISYFQVPVERMPTHEKDLVLTLLKFVFPGAEDDVIAGYAGKRSYKNFVKFDSILEAEGLDRLVADIVDPDESKDIVQSAKAYAKECEIVKTIAIASAKPAAKSKALRKKKMAQKDLNALESAKKYLPVVLGCNLSIESDWHLRWRVSYPTPQIPDNASRCFEENDMDDMRQALLFCLRWAWAQHLNIAKEPCPWDLD